MNEQEKQKNIAKRAHRILDIAMSMVQGMGWEAEGRIEEIQLHYDGYAEPGYSTSSGLIATGNWNTVTKYDSNTGTSTLITNLPDRICHLFEQMGIECEWSDQWTPCCDCGKLIRTDPDCYGWTPSYQFIDGEGMRCVECLEEDPESYLSSLEDNPRTANTIDSIDPCEHGYIKINDDSYETGWHPGQNDDPAKIAKELRAKGISRFLFGIDSVGQFDARWSVYVHEDEQGLLNPVEDCKENPDGCIRQFICNDRCIQKTTEVEVVLPKKEVPCKCCKTSLWEDETPCWKCGADNPTL